MGNVLMDGHVIIGDDGEKVYFFMSCIRYLCLTTTCQFSDIAFILFDLRDAVLTHGRG